VPAMPCETLPPHRPMSIDAHGQCPEEGRAPWGWSRRHPLVGNGLMVIPQRGIPRSHLDFEVASRSARMQSRGGQANRRVARAHRGAARALGEERPSR